MWLRKKGKKKLISLIGFLSANKIENYNRGGNKGEKKIQKNLQNKSKNKNNKCWVIVVRVLSCAGNHSPPHLPRMPSNTVLISGSAVGPAQIIIWSYSCIIFPPMSTTIRASAFSFVGALSGLLYIPQTQSLLSWSCGFNLLPCTAGGKVLFLFLSHTAPGSQLWFYFHFCMCVIHWGCPGGRPMGGAMEKDWPKRPSDCQLQEAWKKDSDRAITPAMEAVCVPEHLTPPGSLQAKQLHHLHAQLSRG